MAMLFTSPHGFSCRVFGFIRHPNTPVRCCQAHIVWLNREAGWRISEDRCRKFCAACFRNCWTVHPQFCFRSMPEKCLEIHRTFFFDPIFHWMLGFLDGWYARAEGHRKNWQSAVAAFVPISPCCILLALTSHSAKWCQMFCSVSHDMFLV